VLQSSLCQAGVLYYIATVLATATSRTKAPAVSSKMRGSETREVKLLAERLPSALAYLLSSLQPLPRRTPTTRPRLRSRGVGDPSLGLRWPQGESLHGALFAPRNSGPSLRSLSSSRLVAACIGPHRWARSHQHWRAEAQNNKSGRYMGCGQLHRALK